MNVLNPEFQTDLLKVILQDHSFLINHRNLIDSNLFKDDIEKVIVDHVLRFFDKFNFTPSENSLLNYILDNGYESDSVKKALDKYYYETVKDIDYIIDSVYDFVKRNKLSSVILNCGRLLNDGKYDEIYNNIKEVVFNYNSDNDIGSLFWDEVKDVLDRIDIKESFIPTGLNELDEILEGGAARGTLNVIITPPNKGKSTLLVNLGKNAVLNGFNTDNTL